MTTTRALAVLLCATWIVACHSDRLARSEGFVTTPDQVHLYYRLIGRGPDTIVALHGGPGATISEFDPALTPLARRHALLLYDQRGNGRSSLVADSTQLRNADHVADLEAIRQHFGIARLTLLGHSWGGGLAALYASAHPQSVAKLILVDAVPPRYHPFAIDENHARLAGFDSVTRARIDILEDAALSDTARDKPALCRAFYALYLRNYFFDTTAMRRAIAAECADTADNIARGARVGRNTTGAWGDWVWDTLVKRVDVPVLVVHGRSDFVPLASSEAWAAAFPRARLLVIDRASHYSFVDRPDVFFPAVERFVSEEAPSVSVRTTVPDDSVTRTRTR
jgi:proline iminopeptidase